MQITQAEPEDLREIWALQHLAFQSEAALLNDPQIPPLRQTLAELQAECRNSLVLKATVEGKLVGSIRARVQDETVYIGKLMVHPGWQKGGIGTMLLREIESVFPGKRFTLLTSSRSLSNLRLYEKNGYLRCKETPMPGGWSQVYLEKTT